MEVGDLGLKASSTRGEGTVRPSRVNTCSTIVMLGHAGLGLEQSTAMAYLSIVSAGTETEVAQQGTIDGSGFQSEIALH